MTTSQARITNRRTTAIGIIFLLVAALLVGRLFWVQVVWGPELREQAQAQRARLYTDPARRGEIVDREGNRLAYTMQARSLTVSPITLRKELREQEELKLRVDGVSKDAIEAQIDARVEDVLRTMANEIPVMIGDRGAERDEAEKEASKSNASSEEPRTVGNVSAREILDKLHADTNYEVLVRNVDPDVAAKVAKAFHGVAADHPVSYTHLTLLTKRIV